MASRILVVDDEEDIRNLVGLWLKTAGYEIIYGVNGQDCIDKAGQEEIDLILLDVMMPGLKPSEVLDGLRKLPKQVPVIYLTAVEWLKETDDQKQSGYVPVMEPPVVDYILKPTEKKKLLSKVKEALDK